MKIFLLLFLLCNIVYSQTLSEIIASTDSLFSANDSLNKSTNIVEDSVLFSTIKTSFNKAKLSYKSAQKGDSLFSAKFYKEAVLEYRRAKFYGNNSKFNDSLTYKTALCLNEIGDNLKSNYEILSLYKDTIFSVVNLANRKEAFAVLYIKNLLEMNDFDKAKKALDEIFLSSDYRGNHITQLKKYYECSLILAGFISDISIIRNQDAYEVLKEFQATPVKNPKTTYWLSSCIPGAGYAYNGDYKMATISAITNIPLAVYLGFQIYGIVDGAIEKNEKKIITNTLDFLLIYNLVFKRYYKGSRYEAVKQSEEINSKNKAKALKELKRIYEID